MQFAGQVHPTHSRCNILMEPKTYRSKSNAAAVTSWSANQTLQTRYFWKYFSTFSAAIQGGTDPGEGGHETYQWSGPPAGYLWCAFVDGERSRPGAPQQQMESASGRTHRHRPLESVTASSTTSCSCITIADSSVSACVEGECCECWVVWQRDKVSKIQTTTAFKSPSAGVLLSSCSTSSPHVMSSLLLLT